MLLLGGVAASIIAGLLLATTPSQAAAPTPTTAPKAEHPLAHYAGLIAERHGVNPALLKAICHIESHWHTRDGRAGEKGVCQILPGTARLVCRRCFRDHAHLVRALNDPYANIELAAMYLVYLGHRVGDDPYFLAAAYNGGPNGPVKYLIKVRQTLPLYTTNPTA